MNIQFLKTPEGTLAYDESGSGPLVICVPGMGDLRQEFRFLVPQLAAAGFRVVTMDVRGHGETSTGWNDSSVVGVGKDILALIRHLGGPAVVVGNSMAAGAAVWAAAEAPQSVQALVLIGPAVHGEVQGFLRLALNAMFARPWGPAAWLAYYKTLFPTRKPADFAEYCAKLKANLAQPGRIEALQHMMLASKAASEACLPRVTQPTLVVMGSKDPDFKVPSDEAHWVSDQMSARTVLPGFDAVVMIDGAGHYPHSEMPEITNPRILEFIKALSLEPTDAQKT
jgi:pimeloyl-ACP methyl ester carboxylesterase